jgi:carboxyl-terminal processing protease
VNAAAIVALATLTSTAAGQQPPASPLRHRTAAEDLQLFSQVLNQIRVNHPDSIDLHELLMAAIEGMVHAADPHSYVVAASRLAPALDSQWRAGRLYPVPVDFSFWGGSPVVVSVAPGSEAAKLDILPGDELIMVDSAPVTAESSEELAIALAGPKGSSVTLTLERRPSSVSALKRQPLYRSRSCWTARPGTSGSRPSPTRRPPMTCTRHSAGSRGVA